jgi:hypothetical protein
MVSGTGKDGEPLIEDAAVLPQQAVRYGLV